MLKMFKMSIKIFTVLIIIQIIFSIFNVSQAKVDLPLPSEDTTDKAETGILGNIFNQGEKWLQNGKLQSTGSSFANVNQTINDIYWILFPIGVVVTVIIGGVLGIKFMMASAEDKAKIKESLVPYVVGCIVIYGAFGIWKICIEIFSVL